MSVVGVPVSADTGGAQSPAEHAIVWARLPAPNDILPPFEVTSTAQYAAELTALFRDAGRRGSAIDVDLEQRCDVAATQYTPLRWGRAVREGVLREAIRRVQGAVVALRLGLCPPRRWLRELGLDSLVSPVIPWPAVHDALRQWGQALSVLTLDHRVLPNNAFATIGGTCRALTTLRARGCAIREQALHLLPATLTELDVNFSSTGIFARNILAVLRQCRALATLRVAQSHATPDAVADTDLGEALAQAAATRLVDVDIRGVRFTEPAFAVFYTALQRTEQTENLTSVAFDGVLDTRRVRSSAEQRAAQPPYATGVAPDLDDRFVTTIKNGEFEVSVYAARWMRALGAFLEVITRHASRNRLRLTAPALALDERGETCRAYSLASTTRLVSLTPDVAPGVGANCAVDVALLLAPQLAPGAALHLTACTAASPSWRERERIEIDFDECERIWWDGRTSVVSPATRTARLLNSHAPGRHGFLRQLAVLGVALHTLDVRGSMVDDRGVADVVQGCVSLRRLYVGAFTAEHGFQAPAEPPSSLSARAFEVVAAASQPLTHLHFFFARTAFTPSLRALRCAASLQELNVACADNENGVVDVVSRARSLRALWVYCAPTDEARAVLSVARVACPLLAVAHLVGTAHAVREVADLVRELPLLEMVYSEAYAAPATAALPTRETVLHAPPVLKWGVDVE